MYIKDAGRVALIALIMTLLAACGGASEKENDKANDEVVTETPAEHGGGGEEPAPEDTVVETPVEEGDVLPLVRPNDSLFVSLPASGRIEMTVQAHESARFGQKLQVRARVPFPRDTLSDAQAVRVVTGDGVVLPARSSELLTWHSADGVSATSVRAVEVAFAWTPADTAPVTFYLDYGVTPVPVGDLPPLRKVAIGQSEFFPLEYGSHPVFEPEVFVTLSPEWLGATLLRGRTLALDAPGAISGFDDLQPEFARTAVNEVRDHVTDSNLINYQVDYEPWLFDRAGTLWNLYLRTGELKWFRHAWRATQFYRDQVKDTGYFALKTWSDFKYSYNLSMFIGYSLTGDDTLLAPIKQVATTAANDGFNPVYSSTLNFWTERHLAYSMQASLVAWELTGDFAHLDRVNSIIAANLAQTRSPDSGEAAIGCILHTVVQHEGGGVNSDRTACSPWMTGLYAEVLWRTWLMSGNADALEQLSLFGDYLSRHGTYVSQGTKASLDGRTFPYYLRGPNYDSRTQGVSDEWTDQEHACDVAALALRSASAKQRLGEDSLAVRATADALGETCLWNISQWVRTSQATVDDGKTFYRLSPPRKFNWWFGATADMSWMKGQW